MIRQRIRITGVAVALAAVAALAPVAAAMPFGGDGRGLAFPAGHSPSAATTVARPNPDQQVTAALRRVVPYVPGAVVAVRPNPDQQAPATHAAPSAATPTFASAKEPRISTGSSFDWAALLIGLGAGGLVGLAIGGYGSAGGRPGLPRRERAAETS